MMRILILDNNIDRDSWGADELRSQASAAAPPGAVIHARRAPAGDLPARAKDWSALIVSGSKTRALERAPWIEHLDQFLGQALDEKIPVLGICYGHQALARVLARRGKQDPYSAVRAASQPEFGWTPIERVSITPLFEGLTDSFHSFSWHRDEVGALPAGARLLARSEHCAVQAFEVEGRPAFGLQFHPERGAEAGDRALTSLPHAERAYAMGRSAGHKLHRAEVGRLIFSNFLNKIATKQ